MNSSRVWAWAIEPGPMQMAGQPGPLRHEASENHGAVVKPRAAVPSRFTHGSDSSVSSGREKCVTRTAASGTTARSVDSSSARHGSASMPGTARQSSSMRQWSGTMLILLPPAMVPTLSVGGPSLPWAWRARPGMTVSSSTASTRRMA